MLLLSWQGYHNMVSSMDNFGTNDRFRGWTDNGSMLVAYDGDDCRGAALNEQSWFFFFVKTWPKKNKKKKKKNKCRFWFSYLIFPTMDPDDFKTKKVASVFKSYSAPRKDPWFSFNKWLYSRADVNLKNEATIWYMEKNINRMVI